MNNNGFMPVCIDRDCRCDPDRITKVERMDIPDDGTM